MSLRIFGQPFIVVNLRVVLLIYAVSLTSLHLNAQTQPGTVLWTYDLTGPATSPAVSSNGTVYIGTSAGLYAITNSGSTAAVKWIFPTDVETPVSIGTDGTVYFGDANPGANLYALNPDGTIQWVISIDPSADLNAISSAPLIGHDNTLYVVVQDKLYAISFTGGTKWLQYVFDDSSSRHSPVMGRDGTIYVCSFLSTALYAFNFDSTPRWVHNFSSPMGESIAVGLNGTVYLSSSSLYALTPDGNEVWHTSPNYGVTNALMSSASVGNDGTIYIGAEDFGLSAFNPDGTLKWHVLASPQSQQAFRNTPAIDSAGNIVYVTSNALWSVDSQGQVQWTVPGDPPDPAVIPTTAAPIIGSDGTIYAFLNYKLYAVAGAGLLADSPWPMYRCNARLTGKNEAPLLANPRKRSDHNFEFDLFSNLGWTNTIQVSSNLFDWSPLTDIVITNLPTDFIDFTATNFSSRFYRAVQH